MAEPFILLTASMFMPCTLFGYRDAPWKQNFNIRKDKTELMTATSCSLSPSRRGWGTLTPTLPSKGIVSGARWLRTTLLPACCHFDIGFRASRDLASFALTSALPQQILK
jgi:hypothetical protein